MDCLKRIGLVAASVMSMSAGVAFANNQNFMPENDLWMEDDLNATQNVNEAAFRAIIKAGREAYASFARQNNEKLVINERWSDSTVNANASRSFGTVTINMYGGLARRPEVIPEGFALVLCHELAHAYGGTPYIQPANRMSAEGQADYYGAGVCAKAVFAKIPSSIAAGSEPPYAVENCSKSFAAGSADYNLCVRRLAGALSLGNLLSTLMQEEAPKFETPDTTEVRQTELSYPNTVQCRVDTMHNAVFGMARPRCWFKN